MIERQTLGKKKGPEGLPPGPQSTTHLVVKVHYTMQMVSVHPLELSL